LLRPTIAQVVDFAAKHFEQSGIAEGRRNAQLLMMHLLGTGMAELLSRGNEELQPDLQAQYAGLVGRRVRHEPVQYITRRAEFWSHEFYVDPRSPIPRPETEHIIEEVIRDFPERERELRVVDVGTGSGILAAVLASEFPNSRVFATDLARGALEVAAINVTRLNVGARVELLHGDLLEPVNENLGVGSVDIVVSNPPYISLGEASGLAPEVVSAEPKGALFAGPTGLEIFQRLIPQAALMLAPGGRLYLECGAGQAGSVSEIINKEKNLRYLRSAKDLQGIERVVVGGRPV
jgi:release factor glutamine methyltransferase